MEPYLLKLKPLVEWVQKNKAHWPAACVVLLVLWIRAEAKYKACADSLGKSKQEVVAMADAKEQAVANCKGRVVIKSVAVPAVDGNPGRTIFVPCPEVAVDFDGGGSASGGSTANANSKPSQTIESPSSGVFLGAGYYVGPYAAVGVQAGKLAAQGNIGLGSYGGQVTWRCFEW